MNEAEELAVESIPRLMLKFSLPAIIGLLVNALYNIVDSIFVGRGVGDLALAGVTVVLCQEKGQIKRNKSIFC